MFCMIMMVALELQQYNNIQHCPHSSRVCSLDLFLSWVISSGGWYSNAKISVSMYQNFGLSVIASADIFPQEMIAAIPWNLSISSTTLNQGLNGSNSLQYYHNLAINETIISPTNQAALFLLLEKNDPHSKWHPYFNILPSSISTPIYYTVDELNQLQASHLKGKCQNVHNYRFIHLHR